MSAFRNWPERQTYDGIDGARQFMADWLEAWEEWQLEVEQRSTPATTWWCWFDSVVA